MNVDGNLQIALDGGRSTKERIEAVHALGGSGSGKAIVALTLVIPREMDPELKAAIKGALVELGATAFFAKNLGAKEDEVRAQAAELIAYVPGPEGVDPLIAALADPVAKVREQAAGALFRFRDGRAIDPLASVLAKDPNDEARAAAAQSLARLGGPKARAALERAAESDESELVRIFARDGLKRLDRVDR